MPRKLMFWKKSHTVNLLAKKQIEHQVLAQGKSDWLQFCAITIKILSRAALIYKATNTWVLNRKGKCQLLVFWILDKKAWTTKTLFLKRFRHCFVPEDSTHLTSNWLPFKVLQILDNGPGLPESPKFKTKSVHVIYLAQNTISLIKPLDQGGPLHLVLCGDENFKQLLMP